MAFPGSCRTHDPVNNCQYLKALESRKNNSRNDNVVVTELAFGFDFFKVHASKNLCLHTSGAMKERPEYYK